MYKPIEYLTRIDLTYYFLSKQDNIVLPIIIDEIDNDVKNKSDKLMDDDVKVICIKIGKSFVKSKKAVSINLAQFKNDTIKHQKTKINYAVYLSKANGIPFLVEEDLLYEHGIYITKQLILEALEFIEDT